MLHPIGQVGLDVLLAVTAPLPLRVIGVADWQCWQRSWLIRLACGIRLRELVDQHTDRPAVVNDVMQGQKQYVQLRATIEQASADQRPAGQIERLARLFHHDLADLRIDTIDRQIANIRHLQRP